jgi:uncharacterized membrane-anchored protein
MSAALLAICIVIQFFKNTSVFISGPVINACLIIAALSVGLAWGLILSCITPVTAFLITGAPIMKIVPGIIPLIMIGNAILVVCVWLFACRGQEEISTKRLIIGEALGSVLKTVFIALTISYGVLATVKLPAQLQPMLPKLQATYSTVQLICAVIGSVIALLIWRPLEKSIKNHNK